MNETAIEVKDVKVAYRSMKSFSIRKSFGKIRQRRDYYEALKGVSFTVPKGKIVGIIGKNGSGKSTLLRTIAGVWGSSARTEAASPRSCVRSQGCSRRMRGR